ncbi:Tripartite ATP-independent periplasmic transporter, DctQ component [compost metagenome]
MVALLFALICVLSIRVVYDDYRYEETSPGIGVPQWWYSIWLPVFSALITIRALGLFARQGKASFEALADDTGEGTVTTKELA